MCKQIPRSRSQTWILQVFNSTKSLKLWYSNTVSCRGIVKFWFSAEKVVQLQTDCKDGIKTVDYGLSEFSNASERLGTSSKPSGARQCSHSITDSLKVFWRKVLEVNLQPSKSYWFYSFWQLQKPQKCSIHPYAKSAHLVNHSTS